MIMQGDRDLGVTVLLEGRNVNLDLRNERKLLTRSVAKRLDNV